MEPPVPFQTQVTLFIAVLCPGTVKVCPYVVVSGQPNGTTDWPPSQSLKVLIVGRCLAMPAVLADACTAPPTRTNATAPIVIATRRAEDATNVAGSMFPSFFCVCCVCPADGNVYRTGTARRQSP